jgi:hypothetical protein
MRETRKTDPSLEGCSRPAVRFGVSPGVGRSMGKIAKPEGLAGCGNAAVN